MRSLADHELVHVFDDERRVMRELARKRLAQRIDAEKRRVLQVQRVVAGSPASRALREGRA